MFRKPIGQNSVGIQKHDTEETGDKQHRQKVPLTFFYPADSWQEECPYKDAEFQRTQPDSRNNGVHTFCGINPPVTDRQKTFPVIIYNHGLCGFEMESTVLCADLASFGFVVVSIGHPFGAAIVTYKDENKFENPEPFSKMRFRLNQIEPLWYEDFLAAAGTLKKMNESDSTWKNRLSFDKMGTIGVSFGGCCSITAALKNKELNYAVNLDGSLFVEPEYIFPEKPVLVICSPFNIKAYRSLNEHGCKNVEVQKIKKLSHFEFSDGIYLSEKGKQNRVWADKISKERALKIRDFINSKNMEK